MKWKRRPRILLGRTQGPPKSFPPAGWYAKCLPWKFIDWTWGCVKMQISITHGNHSTISHTVTSTFREKGSPGNWFWVGQGRREERKQESNNTKNSFLFFLFFFSLSFFSFLFIYSVFRWLFRTVQIIIFALHHGRFTFHKLKSTKLWWVPALNHSTGNKRVFTAVSFLLWRHYHMVGNCLSTICVIQEGIIMLGCHMGICSDGWHSHLWAWKRGDHFPSLGLSGE